ncbi:hypothetical protein [uncultured Jatrophihabitans sp.]|uniref:hypothetical protein n=1 Tax=uncultured Jatrophihabitans sp. TaxID=1610747 RepID=UPI0035CA40A8
MTTRAGAALSAAHRDAAQELLPLLRRAAELDPRCVARLQFRAGAATAFLRLPFGVLVSRSVATSGPTGSVDKDAGVGAGETAGGAVGQPVVEAVAAARELVDWLAAAANLPQPRDADWHASVPPRVGWRRLETVPDDVIRGLVRKGALALKDAAAREGVPGAQLRAEVAAALLDTVVLTVTDDAVSSTATTPKSGTAEVTLRALSALTRMGFLPRGGAAHIDVAGRWIRVAAGYGTVYLEKPGAGLALLR